jgi:1-phosphofructokinase
MAQIFSIVLNTAIDNIIEIEKFEKGIVTSAIYSKYYPSGKAVNSARTIASINENVTVHGFVGKSESDFFSSLNSTNLKMNLAKIKGRTRTNITLIDSNHELVLHTRTKGYLLTKNDFSVLCIKLSKIIKTGDVVILSGSIPEGISVNSFAKIIMICKSKNAKVIFDSSKSFLKSAIPYQPFAIKPNLDELSELVGRQLKTKSEIIEASSYLNHQGIEMVFVSNGAEGVILMTKGSNIYWTASLNLRQKRFNGEEIGCGDAMVGGIAVAIKEAYLLKIPLN